MKKVNEEQKDQFERRALNEVRRRGRKKRERPRKRRRGNDYFPTVVKAPASIDIYSKKNHSKTVEFLARLRRVCSTGKARICFRDTVSITAAAGLLFIAEVDRLVSEFGESRITSTPPPKIRKNKGVESRTVEAVLSQIGFFSLIGKKNAILCNEPNVKCWEYETGTVTQGESAARILEKIEGQVAGMPLKALYRGCIEAMANSVEHAYTGIRQDGMSLEDKRWWMFASVMQNSLVVLICDLGVGIPNTIRHTQSENLLRKLFSTFGFKATTDAEWIKAATLVKETRTQESHRGKGGGDLRSLVREYRNSKLTIFSNSGHYTYLSTRQGGYSPEIIYNHKSSILGTIIEWSIPLDDNYVSCN